MATLDALQERVSAALGESAVRFIQDNDELTVVVSSTAYLSAMQALRAAEGCRFEQLIDLCGVDYSDFKEGVWDGARYAVVCHLLSVSLNQRLRVRVFCEDDDMPLVASLTSIWAGANWFEREAFDMYGILFDGHDDLRRILTDYGFIGYPLRKDFPTSGHVEMRYDADQKRVIYQPVTIEPREITPRIIREDGYGGLQ
jgi:NADH-quinone oxidoreductase subunit C